MPIRGAVKYRTKKTSKGNIRLAFNSKGEVIEAKNMKTGKIHTPAEFQADKKRAKKRAAPKKRGGRKK